MVITVPTVVLAFLTMIMDMDTGTLLQPVSAQAIGPGIDVTVIVKL